MTKVDDALSAAALRLRDFDSSSGFTKQQLLAGLTVPAIADPNLLEKRGAAEEAAAVGRADNRDESLPPEV
jgi:hypothetical protein